MKKEVILYQRNKNEIKIGKRNPNSNSVYSYKKKQDNI